MFGFGKKEKELKRREQNRFNAMSDQLEKMIAKLGETDIDDPNREKLQKDIAEMTNTLAVMEKTKTIKKDSAASRSEKIANIGKYAIVAGLCGASFKLGWTKDHTEDYLPNKETGKNGSTFLSWLFRS